MKELLEKMMQKKGTINNKYGQNVNIDSIMLEINGLESFHFYKQDDLHQMRSISKVLIALAYGILIDRNLVDINERVYPVIKPIITVSNKDNLDYIKKWKLKHLLTYSAGYESQMFSEKYISNINPHDYLNYVVNYELKYKPGTRYAYNNAEIFLLSVFFKEKFKIDITKFIEKEIFSPLGIIKYDWEDYNGYCPGGTGLYITHKDLFKIGKLILNYGRYNKKSIVSKEYIQTMCSTILSTPQAVKPERVLPKYGVGYVMHISRDGYCYKDGTDGQYIIINFEKKQLITILSSEKDMSCVTEILRDLI